jgi:hypothetical protein
MQSSGWMVWIA